MMKRIKKNPMYLYLMVLTICSAAGLQTWRTLFDNFAVHVVHLNGEHVGIIQSVREIPGFLALLVVYVLLVIKEHRLSAISIVILGTGVAATGLLPTFYGVIFTTLIMSFGFHYFETTRQSLTLQYFDGITSPHVFAKLQSFAAATNICVGILIFVLVPLLTYTQLYLGFGGLIIVGGIWALNRNPADRKLVAQHRKMIVKKKYWLFYFLTFMAGARRQIFVAFAIYLLVRKFSFSVQAITVLFLVNNVVTYYLSPYIGKFIVRFGERKLLTIEYLSLIFIFIGYALAGSKIIVAGLYIADQFLFTFAMAIRTFFQKIADPKDIAPSMAVGFTINHIAAVLLPAIGGLLWMLDYRIPFIAGAILSAVSLILVQLISGQLQKAAVEGGAL